MHVTSDCKNYYPNLLEKLQEIQVQRLHQSTRSSGIAEIVRVVPSCIAKS